MSVLLGRQKVGPHFFYKLYCFHFVVSLGSYRLAAEYLHLTASTLSRAIQSLESGLQLRLLNRKTRSKITLSAQGSRIFALSAQLLHILEGLGQHKDPSNPSTVLITNNKPSVDLNTDLRMLFQALALYFKKPGSDQNHRSVQVLCKHLKKHSCKKSIKKKRLGSYSCKTFIKDQSMKR